MKNNHSKRTYKNILNVTFFAILGGFLAFMGYPYTKWQYWIVFLLVVAIQINTARKEE